MAGTSSAPAYVELLRILEQAAHDQRSVALTKTESNVYVRPVLQGSASSVSGRELAHWQRLFPA